MVAIIEKREMRDFDWLTTLLAVAIASFGIWQIHNALPSESYWTKQIIGLGIALVAFAVIAFSDYRRIIELAPIFYVFGLFLLFLVLTPLGVEVNGQRAIWTVGPYPLRLYNGDIEFTRLIKGHVLIWQEGDITYRLETDLSLEEAVKIAESLQPIEP